MWMFFNAVGESIFTEEGKQFVTNVVSPILMIIMVLVSIAMLVCILRQSGDPEDLGALTGNTETFYGKNKEKTQSAIMRKLTVWFAIGLVAVSIIYFVLQIL